jgi:hypothetical protein
LATLYNNVGVEKNRWSLLEDGAADDRSKDRPLQVTKTIEQHFVATVCGRVSVNEVRGVGR